MRSSASKCTLDEPTHMGFRALACVLLLAPLTYVAAATGDRDPVLTLSHFERLYITNESTPPNRVEQGWETVELKDVWSRRRMLDHHEAWYRTTFKWKAGADDTSALFVPRVSANASFWVNGHEIGNTGPFTDPLPRNWNHPVFLPFPSALLRDGNNELYVRLKVDDSRAGMLFEISIGPRTVLYPRYSRSYFAKVTASEMLTAVILVGVAVVLVFYFTTNLPRSYLFFALGSLCWALYSFELFVNRIPVPTRVWVTFFTTMALLAGYFYVRTVHEILGLRRRRLERCALGVVAVVLMFVVTPQELFPALRATGWIAFFSALAYVGVMLSIHGVRRRNPHWRWLLLCGLTVLLVSGYDIALGTLQVTAEFAKFPYLPLVGFLAGATVFIERLITTTREHAHLQNDLEATIDRESNAISSERARLMREIHDGVGSQLVSTLARLETRPDADQEIVSSLRASLEDLRLIVHSLEAMAQQGDIVTILATVRERIEPGLNEQGIEFVWLVQPLPKVDGFGSEDALQLMRLVQEAVTNVIKHARATHIELACGEETRAGSPGVFVEIADNGVGFPERQPTAGLGLASMRHRAESLHGELSIRSSSAGTRVRLWLPVHPNTQSGAAPQETRDP